MWIYIPDDTWGESWERTLDAEWEPTEETETDDRHAGVHVSTAHWWLFPGMPYDATERPYPAIPHVTYRRESIDGRTLDLIRFTCPYDRATVTSLIRELVRLGLRPTDRWSLLLKRTIGR